MLSLRPRLLRTACAVLLVMAAFAAPARAQTTALYFESQAGDYIGGGITRTYSPADGTFALSEFGGQAHVSVTGPAFSFWWYLNFSAPTGATLAPGSFLSARRFPTVTAAGIDISGSGRGCNATSGRFLVRELERDMAGAIVRLAVDFEQHCENADPALFGAIRYNSTVSTLTPFDGAYPDYSMTVVRPAHGTVTGDGITCGASQDPCVRSLVAPAALSLTAAADPGYVFLGWAGDCSGAATATVRINQPRQCQALFESATSGVHTALFMDSQTGDFVGAGRQWLYNTSNAAFTISRTDTNNGPGVSVRISGDTSWTLSLDANANGPLAVGQYAGAIRYPFNGFHAGLDVSGDGRGCNQETGWFVVRELTLASDGSIQQFAADIEQHCENADAGLFAAIRYNSSVSTLVPFDGAYPQYRVTITRPSHGTVTAAAGAIACGASQDPCVHDWIAPATVALTATADPGYVFTGWTGSCSGGMISTVRVNQPLLCEAIFESTTTGAHTALFMDSQAGDYIGTGRQWLYNGSNAAFTISRTDNSTGPGVSVRITADTSWTLNFDADANGPLGVATYVGAVRYPFNGFRAGLDVSGDGRGCNKETGRFIVRELVFATDGSIQRFAADAEQHCENADPGLFVAIRYNSTVASLLPFDGLYPDFRLTIRASHGTITGDGVVCTAADATCTKTLAAAANVSVSAAPEPGYVFLGWSGSCFGGATLTVRLNQPLVCEALFDSLAAPTPRTGVFFDSQPGDYIGQARQWMFNATNAVVAVSQNGSVTAPGVHVTLTADSMWSLDFTAGGNAALMPGRYTGAMRYPFNGAAPGLSVWGDGRGCNTVSGWFVVRELAVGAGGAIVRFAADFEQHCEGQDPALFGSVRYNSTVPTMTPFDGSYPTYRLTIVPGAHGVVTGGGLACGATQNACVQTLPAISTVVLTAIPDRGYALRAWSGDCTGGRTTSIRVNSLEQCTPLFVPTVVPHDLDGDGLGDVAVWRPGDGTWYWGTSRSGFNDAAARARQWGNKDLGDVPLLGDVDGDAIDDLIVWRASTGTWYWLPSSTGFDYSSAGSRQWGDQRLGDVPMVGDMDGDGRADLVIWRRSNGTFYWLTSTSGYATQFARGIQWGNDSLGDQPLLGDFDGDGLQDLAVWRASTGTWYWLSSSVGYSYLAQQGVQWGAQSEGDVPFTGDLDGDGRSELIVWRPANGTWFWLTSSSGYGYPQQRQQAWGSSALGDIPALADFDGDRSLDLAVWRSSTGMWYWLPSSSGFSTAAARGKRWGALAAGDIPMVR